MVANLTDLITEADGSAEFREILRVLIQGKHEHGFSLVGPTRGRWQNIRIRVERVLLISGLALVTVYGAACFESFLSSRADLQRFAAIAPSSASANREVAEGIGSSGVDFSLWNQNRVPSYTKRVLKQPSRRTTTWCRPAITCCSRSTTRGSRRRVTGFACHDPANGTAPV